MTATVRVRYLRNYNNPRSPGSAYFRPVRFDRATTPDKMATILTIGTAVY